VFLGIFLSYSPPTAAFVQGECRSWKNLDTNTFRTQLITSIPCDSTNLSSDVSLDNMLDTYIVQLLPHYLTSSCLLALSATVLLPLHPGLTMSVWLQSIQLVFCSHTARVLERRYVRSGHDQAYRLPWVQQIRNLNKLYRSKERS